VVLWVAKAEMGQGRAHGAARRCFAEELDVDWGSSGSGTGRSPGPTRPDTII